MTTYPLDEYLSILGVFIQQRRTYPLHKYLFIHYMSTYPSFIWLDLNEYTVPPCSMDEYFVRMKSYVYICIMHMLVNMNLMAVVSV